MATLRTTSPVGTLAPPRLSPLDGLRGVAAIAVLLFHQGFRSAQLFPQLGRPLEAASWGYYGVALFFTISGFVILLSLQGSTPRRFVLSRLIRLYPIYWICAALTFTIVTLSRLPGRQVSPIQALGDLPLVQGLWNAAMIDPVYWTLAVEGLFYLIVGVLFFAGALGGRRAVVSLGVWLALCVGVMTAARSAVSGGAGWGGAAAGLLTAVQWMPLFVLGIAFFLLRIEGRRTAGVGLGVAAITAAFLAAPDPRLFIVLPVICALMAAALWGPQALLGNRPLAFLGEISYPLYLIHQNLGYVVLLTVVATGMSRSVGTIVAVVAMLALATALTFLVDRPLRRSLRRRLLRSDTVE